MPSVKCRQYWNDLSSGVGKGCWYPNSGAWLRPGVDVNSPTASMTDVRMGLPSGWTPHCPSWAHHFRREVPYLSSTHPPSSSNTFPALYICAPGNMCSNYCLTFIHFKTTCHLVHCMDMHCYTINSYIVSSLQDYMSVHTTKRLTGNLFGSSVLSWRSFSRGPYPHWPQIITNDHQ